MNKKEIKFDHFKDVEELIKHLEMWYAEDDYDAYDRFFGLRDARIMGMIIYELNNVINEIEAIVYADISNIDARISIQEVLDKLKELKEEK